MKNNRERFLSCVAIAVLTLLPPPPLPAQTASSFQYFYDDLGQLTKVMDASGNVVSYNYDSSGNILSISRSSVTPGSLAIFNFTPQRAVAGATVTIQGQGFSPTPANNTVLFNGTAATVAAATAAALVVSVPSGAKTGPLSVTVAGVTAQGGTFTVIPTLLSISVTPANSFLALGASVQFAAIGNYSDGSTQDLTSSVTWQSSNQATATIASLGGLAKSVGIGTTLISAIMGAVGGSTTLTVTPPVTASITLAPANFSTGPGSSVQFVATLIFQNGTREDVTSSVTWSSSNAAVATISNSQGSQGIASTLASGSTTIAGTFGSVAGSTTLTVSASASVPRYLYMVNNEPTISSYSVNATTGELRSNGYTNATFPSGTPTEPIATTPSGKFLYSVVGTPAQGGSIGAVFGYVINSNGTLTPVAASPFNTAANASPSHMVVESSSKFLYMSDCNNQAIWGFTIDPASGALTQIAGSPFKGAGNCFNNFNTYSIQLELDPKDRFLYGLSVANQSVSAYAINAITGALTPVQGSPFSTPGTFATGITEEPSGKFLYISNNSGVSNTIGAVDGFSIDQTSGALAPLAGSPFPAGTNNGGLAADPLGKYLYVLAADPAAGVSSIGVWPFTIDPITGGIAPVGIPAIGTINLPFYLEIIADPSGDFVFTKSSTVNPNLSVLHGFRVDRSTGALTLVSENRTKFTNRNNAIALSTGPTPVTYIPQFAYVANSSDNTVSVYAIDGTSGLLSTRGSVGTGTNPQSIATDPLGKFLYVANQGSNNLSGYTINANTGLPSSIPGSPFATGVQPVSVTVDPAGLFVFVANAGDDSVSVYSVNPVNGVLTLSSTPTLVGTGCAAPGSLVVDPRGLILYVSCPTSNNTFLAQINPSTGALGQCGGIWSMSPLGTSAALGGVSICISPSGKFVYLLNQTSAVIYELTITDNQSGCVSGTTGGITLNGTIPVGPAQSLTQDPFGKFLYGAEGGFNDVLGDAIDFSTGTLTPSPGSPFAAGTFPTAITVDGSGRFAYMVNRDSNTVSAYSINPSTGALISLATPDFPTGKAPVSVTTTSKIQ